MQTPGGSASATAQTPPPPCRTLTTSTSSLAEQHELLGVKDDSTHAAIKRAFDSKARQETDEEKLQKLQEAKRSLMQLAGTTKYLFIGSPGTGKSTLLNGLLGKVVFKPGPSTGRGLTLEPRHVIDGDTYISVPCLADEKLRAAAAAAITHALREGGQFKVIFVLTMESGRLRPADKATMQLVLNSAPVIDDNFGIIVNKVSKNLYQKAPFEKYLAQHWGGETPPKHVAANQRNEELEDEEGKLVLLAPELFQFVESLPTAFVESGEVSIIKYETFDAVQKLFYEASCTKLGQESEARIEGIGMLEKMYTEKLEAQQKDTEKLQAQLEQSAGERRQLEAQLAQLANKCKNDFFVVIGLGVVSTLLLSALIGVMAEVEKESRRR